MKKLIILLLLLGVAVWLGQEIYHRLEEERAQPMRHSTPSARAVPVEIASMRVGTMDRIRDFTGTLDANAEFVVVSALGGRVEEIGVHLSDRIDRGQVVVRLDNDVYQQELSQVQADLAVARAQQEEARSLLEIAERELDRMQTLRTRGVSSESEEDAARADQLARSAHLKVAQAQVTRAEAAVETARIRLGYSQVTARWTGGRDQRTVAERYVDEGQIVSANDPLLRIMELDPIRAVFFVTEKDYGMLLPGQRASLRTDAYPEEVFEGAIDRIAPSFQENTRKARVELRVDNPDHRLKPGMFIRVRVFLEQVTNAIIIPERSLVRRDGDTGVFMVSEDRQSVRWQPVKVGIRANGLLQVLGDIPLGDVVVIGQHLLDDGMPIRITDRETG